MYLILMLSCLHSYVSFQAFNITLESARLDVVIRMYQLTKDTEIFSYIIEAVRDTGFTVGFRNMVILQSYRVQTPKFILASLSQVLYHV